MDHRESLLINYHLTIKLHTTAANQIGNQIGRQSRIGTGPLYLVYLLSKDHSSDGKASGKSSTLKYNCSIFTESNKHLQNKTIIYDLFVYERSIYSFSFIYLVETFQFLEFVPKRLSENNKYN